MFPEVLTFFDVPGGGARPLKILKSPENLCLYFSRGGGLMSMAPPMYAPLDKDTEIPQTDCFSWGIILVESAIKSEICFNGTLLFVNKILR